MFYFEDLKDLMVNLFSSEECQTFWYDTLGVHRGKGEENESMRFPVPAEIVHVIFLER